MTNYSRGRIYKIVCDGSDKIYIGSTTKKYLSSRMVAHRAEYKKGKNCTSSRELFDKGNCSIVLLENFSCTSKDELRQRERYYFDLFKSVVVNKNRPSITDAERVESNSVANRNYYIQNRESHLQNVRKYYIENKDTILEKRKQQITCECGGKHTNHSKSKHLATKMHLAFIESKAYRMLVAPPEASMTSSAEYK